VGAEFVGDFHGGCRHVSRWRPPREELDAWISTLEKAPLQPIMVLEKKSSSHEGIEAEQRYRETMKVSPPSEERRAAIDRVVAAVTAGFEVAHRDTVRAWLEAAALP